jgi:thiamine-monophosphate kinase
MDEFEVIQYLLAHVPAQAEQLRVGIGDDAAIFAPPVGQEIAVATDSLVLGTHFTEELSAAAIAHRALAVNLSDLAAMGAQPCWFLLNLSLPTAEASWVKDFAKGLAALARRHAVTLIGGDTVRGPLCVGVTAIGYVPTGQALQRNGAQPGDGIFVTGRLGNAGYAWRQLAAGAGWSDTDPLFTAFSLPSPRVQQGLALRDLATAAIDVSDGLQVDLQRLMSASGLGAELRVEQLPLDPCLIERCGIDRARGLAMLGGDDYELCFTVPMHAAAALQDSARHWDCGLTQIGQCRAGAGIDLKLNGRSWSASMEEYQHF